MKAAISILLALFLIAAVGCESPRGGGPAGGEEFRIRVPAFDTRVQQGSSEYTTVTLNRGRHFRRDVDLEFRATEGIHISPTSTTVRAGDSPDVQLRIEAPREAALGEYRIHVRGVPDRGEPTSTEFRVRVVEP